MASDAEYATSATEPEKTWSGGSVSINKQHRTRELTYSPAERNKNETTD
jgi:hypothetical protein